MQQVYDDLKQLFRPAHRGHLILMGGFMLRKINQALRRYRFTVCTAVPLYLDARGIKV